mgnify:CR=1 FL=1
MNRIVVNGVEYTCNRGNIVITNNQVIVGKTVIASIESESEKNVKVEIFGDAGDITCPGSVIVNGNCKAVDCGGSCQVNKNVNGNIDAGGSVTVAGYVDGNIGAGGSVKIGKR